MNLEISLKTFTKVLIFYVNIYLGEYDEHSKQIPCKKLFPINIDNDDSKYMCGHIIDGKFDRLRFKLESVLQKFLIPYYRAYSYSRNFIFTHGQGNCCPYDIRTKFQCLRY